MQLLVAFIQVRAKKGGEAGYGDAGRGSRYGHLKQMQKMHCTSACQQTQEYTRLCGTNGTRTQMYGDIGERDGKITREELVKILQPFSSPPQPAVRAQAEAAPTAGGATAAAPAAAGAAATRTAPPPVATADPSSQQAPLPPAVAQAAPAATTTTSTTAPSA